EQGEKCRTGRTAEEVEGGEFFRPELPLQKRREEVEGDAIEREVAESAVQELEGERFPDAAFEERRPHGEGAEPGQRVVEEEYIEEENGGIRYEQELRHRREPGVPTSALRIVSRILAVCLAHVIRG